MQSWFTFILDMPRQGMGKNGAMPGPELVRAQRIKTMIKYEKTEILMNSFRAVMAALMLTPFLAGSALAQGAGADLQALRAGLAKLEFLVGDWRADGKIHPGPLGGGGDTSGAVKTTRGVGLRYVMSDYTTTLPGGLPYAAHTLITFAPRGDTYVAYGFNNLLPFSLVYRGKFTNDATLVMETGVDPNSSRQQRLTYTRNADGSIGLVVENSGDGGKTFIRQSELTMRK
jgi:hypothetical protein